MSTLGDGGGLPNDDLSYTGELSTSSFSLDYYREKAREFQVLLNSVDDTYRALWSVLNAGVNDPELQQDIERQLAEFDSKRTALKLTAEAINAGAAVINAAGGRFPQLSIPGTLGALPAIPMAAIVAIGGIATLAVWGRDWIAAAITMMQRAQMLENMTPEQRSAVAAATMQADTALRATETSIWGAAGSALKWVAIGALGFLAWQYYKGQTGRRR